MKVEVDSKVGGSFVLLGHNLKKRDLYKMGELREVSDDEGGDIFGVPEGFDEVYFD